MKRVLLSLLAAGMAACTPAADDPQPKPAADVPREACLPQGYDRAGLEALKVAGFEISDDVKRQEFALAIAGCLASPDPALRDGIAYEALARMMRAQQLTSDTMRGLLADLQIRLERINGPDDPGFEKPFAALALSEVARADRIQPFLTDGEFLALVVKAQFYMANVTDYRGFDEREGWRHGVAHGSDLLMQLALNPRVDKESLQLIVSGVGAQVAPKVHSYVHGESARLARPILFAASKDVMTEVEWSNWLKQVATPPADIAAKLYGSAEGLAWRHNTSAFLQALYVGARLSEDMADDVLIPGLEAAFKEMP